MPFHASNILKRIAQSRLLMRNTGWNIYQVTLVLVDIADYIFCEYEKRGR